MGRGGARTDVELVEDDEGDAGGAPPTGSTPGTTPGGGGVPERSHRARRRVLVVGAALLVLVTAGAAVGQSVVTARDRERIAAVAGLPGVVDAVDGPVTVLRTAADESLRRATTRTPDGLLVSSHEGDDGRATVRAVDPTDGTVVWRAVMIEDRATLAVPPGGEVVRSAGACAPVGAARDRLVCLADDAVALVGRGTLTQRRPTATSLRVLDARTGAVVADLSAAVGDALVSRSLAVLDDLVVVAGVDGSTARVRALTVEGAVAWEATFPTTTTTAFGSHVELRTTTAEVAVVTPDALRLLDATGRTRREVALRSDEHVRGTSGAAVLVEVAGVGTRVVRADAEHRLTGGWVEPVVDDGSAPGMVLTSDDAGLRAWDDTGTELWAWQGRVTTVDGLVLDGRVHVGSGAALVALDAATGEPRWRAADLLPESGLTTDGRHVFALAPRPDGDRPRDVVALDPGDGRVAWRVTLPTDVDGLRSLHGVLVAYSLDPQPDGARPVYTVLGRA